MTDVTSTPRRRKAAAQQTIFRNASPTSGYTSISNQLLQCKGLAPEVRGFIATLLSYPRDWQFSSTWAADHFGLGDRKLKRIIREAKAAGFMKVQRRKGDSGRFSGGALFMFTDTPGQFTESDETSPMDSTISDVLHRVENPPGGECTPIQRKHSLQRTEEPTNAHPADGATVEGVKTRRESDGYIPTDFEAFWSAYPNKRGKEIAKRLWRDLGKFDREAAIRGIRLYEASVSGKRYLKHGNNYLKERVWEEIGRPEPGKPMSDDAIWEGRAARVARDWVWGPEQSWGPKLGEPGCRMPQHLQEMLRRAQRAIQQRERLTK